MALIDLKMSKKDMAEEASPVSAENQNPYPYGACLHLDTDELEKLKIKELPAVGDEYHIRAVGRVTSVSSNESVGGERRVLDIQIEMMELTHEDEAEAEPDSVAEEEAEDAENSAVSGAKTRTIMHSTYRGRS